MTRNDKKLAAHLASLADEGGTIPAGKLRSVFPGRPERHGTTTLRQAWRWALPHLSADDIAEALWG